MAEESLDKFVKFIDENKGQRKFKQSVELAINFKGVDFNKQDNRLNLEVLLPNGKGSKQTKVAVFATERSIIEDARKHGIEVIDGNELAAIAGDAARMNSILEYELVAQPNLMPNIAKFMGKVLGPRNKMPKPLLGSLKLENVAGDLNKRIVIRSKGKYVPTVHCVVGSEDMESGKLYENAREVIGSVSKKVGQNHIKSIYVKLTMSKPMRIE